ncbi:MAG: hypothetical protein BYD32DRAFT_419915 [Podila humilis]|nr:MAG: hypothetical protein BYD32DRAFT_419915 [Podila humilis]
MFALYFPHIFHLVPIYLLLTRHKVNKMTSSTPGNPEAGLSQDHLHTPQTLHFNGYTIQMHDEKQESSPAPVQVKFTSKVSKKKKTIAKKIALVLLLILGYLFYEFILPIYYNSPYYPPWGHHDRGVIIGDTCSHDTGLLRSDLCRANGVKWDGPSTFSTASERFLLTFGRGNIKAKVYIQTSAQVQEPTLKMAGYVSPVDNNDDDVDVVPALTSNTNDETTTEIEHQGVTLQITKDTYAFDVQIKYQDRELVTPDGEKYCACAHLTVHVLLPESYTEYTQLFIRGATADIEILDVENIGFKELWFDIGTGSVISTSALVVDALAVDVKTGNVEIRSIESATEGEALGVIAEVVTGNVVLGANTKPATSVHNVHAGSTTGDVKVTVTPSSLSSSWSKPADLSIRATTSVGDARALVELESRQQTLRLDISSSTGSASALISDDFTGELFVESKLGSAEVYEAEESESKIRYEKQTALVKEGVKSFAGQKPQEGRVDLQSSNGLVVLEFTM